MKIHKKYRILGVGFLLLTVLSLSLLVPTYAVDGTNPSDTGETTTPLTCVELAEKYGLYIKETGTTNQYIVIRDNTLACGDSESAKVPLQLIAINGIAVENGAKLEKPNDKFTVEAMLLHGDLIEYMTVTLQNLNDPNEKIDVRYEIEVTNSTTTTIGVEANSNYWTTCATFRNEVAAMDAAAQNYFAGALSYCWKEYVPTGTNYTADEVTTKIARAKSSWEAFNQSTVAVSQTFMQEFNRIKNNAIAKGNKYDSKSVIPDAANAIQLKCKYDYLPTAGAVYTNEYGEKINSAGDIVNADGTVISDGDDTYAYINKDYYYAVNTEEDGVVKYVYNLAPGKTKTETQTNVCKKTCEETVKVEYGPPVASKAGLCFEYQVKVTSYVNCTTAFDADPPKADFESCDPGVRCVSRSGTERRNPQAGPTADYETCIFGCDGGKYTQACSTKCYNEVYAKNNNSKIKLTAADKKTVATQLAKTTTTSEETGNYSVDQCLLDNSGHYGCYYYDNNTIKWQRIETYDRCSNTSLGRWYIANNYVANKWYMKTLCNNTADYDYIADQDGFVRHNYGGSLCDDTCVWKNDCDGKYLNPGTIAEDYKRNETEYETARAACAGGATCSTSTSTYNIAIKYDTKDQNGTTTVNKVYFPYTKKPVANPTEDANEYSTITKTTLAAGGVVAHDSILLNKDGCYADKNAGNKYMTEWSFPGTYIHNKTGEISFQKPGDTSGWYLEDNKFCMPLDAQSVNVKWWEWYKVGTACYTRTDIENELNGTAGTSNGYNIEAITSNFGYFDWNFDIKCFYGIRNEVCDLNTTGCCNPPTKKAGMNYTVRTVNRENMFPNAPIDGIVSADTRDIGFNWTDAAAITEFKNPLYKVNPLALIEDIETNASQLYNDDNKYLDYQFYLTPQVLRDIRNYNNNNDYGAWNGDVSEVNGVMAYSSNLFRPSGHNQMIIDQDSIKKLGTIGKNNQ